MLFLPILKLSITFFGGNCFDYFIDLFILFIFVFLELFLVHIRPFRRKLEWIRKAFVWWSLVLDADTWDWCSPTISQMSRNFVSVKWSVINKQSIKRSIVSFIQLCDFGFVQVWGGALEHLEHNIRINEDLALSNVTSRACDWGKFEALATNPAVSDPLEHF
jgi:hypothetical protein